MAEARLAVADLTVRRGGRVVLDRVAMSVEAGSLLAVLGPNGAGKSTLLKAAAGLLEYQGRISIDGQDASGLSGRERARRVAYVPQHSALEAALPVHEVVAQGRFAHRGFLAPRTRADQAAIEAALARSDTTRLAERSFNRLSYGERRLVLLARALATGAGVLLLDEPTAALDVRHALELLAVLRRLASEGAAVALVLHQLHEAASSCDRALLLAGGQLVASGPVAEVIAPEPVRRVYGVELVPGGQVGYRLGPEERS